jgi:hypothetical protein
MDFLELTKSFGVPVAFLVMIALGFWRAANWSAKNIIHPLASRHLEFLEHMTASSDVQSKALASLSETQRSQVALIDINTTTLEEIRKVVLNIEAAIQRDTFQAIERVEELHANILRQLLSRDKV